MITGKHKMRTPTRDESGGMGTALLIMLSGGCWTVDLPTVAGGNTGSGYRVFCGDGSGVLDGGSTRNTHLRSLHINISGHSDNFTCVYGVFYLDDTSCKIQTFCSRVISQIVSHTYIGLIAQSTQVVI